jgi:anti-sigma B factor antagonist
MSHSAAFAVQVRDLGTPCPVVSVSGEVDLATAPQVASSIASVLAKHPLCVVLNLRDTTFMDCSGVNVILETKSQLPTRGGVILREPSPSVRRILGILKLDSLCATEPSAA